MKLVLATMLLAVLAGYVLGGRLSRLATLRIRWAPLALLGLLLQVIVPPGRWPLALLLLSFVLLSVFAVRNIGTAGFPLILIGVALNFLVIGLDQGMPVTRHSLAASGQMGTLQSLIHDGGAKHHLAGSSDRLLFLGDVIAVPSPIGQSASAGDAFTYAGVAWLIAAGMSGHGTSVVGRRRAIAIVVPAPEADGVEV
jgi:Family of unknown function (DUF5317)